MALLILGGETVADHEVRIITKMDNTQLDKAADHAEEKIDEVGKKQKRRALHPNGQKRIKRNLMRTLTVSWSEVKKERKRQRTKWHRSFPMRVKR